jgi:MarR family transcriptional regulator, 2-MHQ and catechol-resistance regulon repressor
MAAGESGDRQGQALKAWVVLARAYNTVSARAQADIARHDLTHAEFAILEALLHRGPLLLRELKEKILVTAGGITYLVDRLQARGLVERRPCERDRRAYYATLTVAGQELIAGIFPEHARAIEAAFAALTDEELVEAARLMRKLGRSAAGEG